MTIKALYKKKNPMKLEEVWNINQPIDFVHVHGLQRFSDLHVRAFLSVLH